MASKETRTGWIYILCNESDTDHVKVCASPDRPETPPDEIEPEYKKGHKAEHEAENKEEQGVGDFEVAVALLFADQVSNIEQKARELLKPHQDETDEELYRSSLQAAEAAITRASKQFKEKTASCYRSKKYDHADDSEQTRDCALKSAKIAARHGDPEAQFYIAVCYAEGSGVSQDYKEAARWYRKAAQSGHADAQDNLGVFLDHGKGVEQNHLEAALWFKEAAKQGSPSAQMNLGHLYYNGQGVKKSSKKSMSLWLKAAEQGHPAALLNLARCYADGRGTKQDHEQAFTWYQKAAEQNLSKAQASLAKCYLEGCGTDKDPNTAKHWLEKAIEQGFEDSENLLEEIIEQRANSFQLIATESDRLSKKPSIPEINAITDALDEAFPEWHKNDNANYQLIENLYDNFEHLR